MREAMGGGVIFTILLVLTGPCLAEIKIDQKEKRMKATIPADASQPPGRTPNFLYQGASSLSQGVYDAAKAPVDAVGKGTDFAVESIQKASRKTYDWISSPFRKADNS